MASSSMPALYPRAVVPRLSIHRLRCICRCRRQGAAGSMEGREGGAKRHDARSMDEEAAFGGPRPPARWPASVYVHGLGAASGVYHAHIAADPELAGRRSLFVDLPGHGISDRPATSATPWRTHADALAAALTRLTCGAPSSSGTAWAAPSPSCWPPSPRPGLPSGPHRGQPRPGPARPAGAAAASPPTVRRSSSRARAAQTSSTGSGPTGRPPCAWPTRTPCTAAPGLVRGTESHDGHDARRVPSIARICPGRTQRRTHGRNELKACGRPGGDCARRRPQHHVRQPCGGGRGRIRGAEKGFSSSAVRAGWSALADGQRQEAGVLVGVRRHAPPGTGQQRTEVGLGAQVVRGELRPWRAASAALPIGWNSASAPPGRTTRANSRSVLGVGRCEMSPAPNTASSDRAQGQQGDVGEQQRPSWSRPARTASCSMAGVRSAPRTSPGAHGGAQRRQGPSGAASRVEHRVARAQSELGDRRRVGRTVVREPGVPVGGTGGEELPHVGRAVAAASLGAVLGHAGSCLRSSVETVLSTRS